MAKLRLPSLMVALLLGIGSLRTASAGVRLGTISVGAGYGFSSGPVWPGYYSPFFYGPWIGYSFTPSPIYLVPEPDKGQVSLQGRYKDAEVYLDNAYAGTAATLKKFWLAPGVYDLEVRPKDQTPQEETHLCSDRQDSEGQSGVDAMIHIGKGVLIAGFLNCCLAVGQLPAPRASAAAYPASKVQSVYSIGAKQLSKTEVRNSFATPLADRYIVVEIGFYPADSKTISLNQADFALRTSDGKDLVSPTSPATIASICQKRPQSSNDVTLYPTANVGYVSYPSYDGSGRRVSGPVYGAGMGVGVNKNPSAATTDSDRQTMETELLDKQLNDAEVSKPVAGYLYFPIATKQKVEYQLEYHGTDAVTSLPLKAH